MTPAPTTSLRIWPPSLPVDATGRTASPSAARPARLVLRRRRFDDGGLGGAARGGDEIRLAGRIGNDRRPDVFERRFGGGDAVGGGVAAARAAGAGLQRMVGRQVGSIGRRSGGRRRIRARRRRGLVGGRRRGTWPAAAGATGGLGDVVGKAATGSGACAWRLRRPGAVLGMFAARGSWLLRMPVSMVASRSTTWPSVPCTVSSESWVRWTSRLSALGVGAFDAARDRRHALAFDLDQQVGKPALDRAEMVEARVGGVELLDQLA